MIRRAKVSDLLQIRSMLHMAATLGAPRANGGADLRTLQEAGYVHVAMDHAAVAGVTVFWEDGMDLHLYQFAVAHKFKRGNTVRALLAYVDKTALSDHRMRLLVHEGAAGFEVLSFCRGRGFSEIDQRTLRSGARVRILERALR
ncbi:MAG: hypothetical protein AAF281_15175 [Pseudomonadota bacterium]